jgi:two-component system sensor histidine kinase ChvG
MTQEKRRRFRPGGIQPITRRILAVNVLALFILVAGLLYLGQYRRSLMSRELAALSVQAEMFAGALGESTVTSIVPDQGAPATQAITEETARQVIRRLAETTGTRARLFAPDGHLVADSRILSGPGGMVQIEELPPPEMTVGILPELLELYDRLVERLPGSQSFPAYREHSEQQARHYREATIALSGENATRVWAGNGSELILSAAVPVQRYKQVLGALMLSKNARDIDAALFEVRQNIMTMFALALGITILLSIYLAGTIARPIHRLAAAAERVRKGHLREKALPVFADRDDEIGELAGSLSDMTDALIRRMDAIERFAADVSHEIKNPLTSLNSAVETAARVKDPAQQQRLMAIIQEDVQRLDRLITDISNASRLDAELSRTEQEPVDLSGVLESLCGNYATRSIPGSWSTAWRTGWSRYSAT